jgi:heme-degrading monooxygenase HmoA
VLASSWSQLSSPGIDDPLFQQGIWIWRVQKAKGTRREQSPIMAPVGILLANWHCSFGRSWVPQVCRCMLCLGDAISFRGSIMIAVISEVWPFPDRRNDYISLSDELRPHVEAIDGFISSERFESAKEPGKYVSVSYWRDGEALARWRNLEQHRVVMAKGRGGILRDYRIRATKVLWDYSMNDREQAPMDSRLLFG